MTARKRKVMMLVAVLIALGSLAAADEISLTVYNNNLGVVREQRTLTFEQGSGRIAFMDVASQIDATSVTLEMVDPKQTVQILEQNYAYDLVSPDKIYSKYIDQEIEIITEKGESFVGTLLSFTGGYLVIKQNDGHIRSIAQGVVQDVTFPELPEGLITRPTLFWLYKSNFAGPADAVVSYQTGGISWNAEYVGVLNPDEKTLNLSGWVSLNNRSGKTYRDAKLKVVAGDINRISQPRPKLRGGADVVTLSAAETAGFEEKPFFEYHLYTLPRPATIADNEIKQISMFDPAQTVVDKEFRYSAEPGQTKVNIQIKMNNSKEVGLGMPLPAGRVRIFKADTDGSLILLGEDKIDHTPRNEEIKLKIGDAFDIVGETTVISRRRISDRVEETDYRVELRNQKETPAMIIVSKQLNGFWEILNASIDYVKKSATEVQWTVTVLPGSKNVIDFTVRTNW